jgi:hypothetical protein
MIIHAHIRKAKKYGNAAKNRELRKEWDEMLNKYGISPTDKKNKNRPNTNTNLRGDSSRFVDTSRTTSHIPSRDSWLGDTIKKPTIHYTGDKMKGIGTLHKSNAVPIFSDEEAKDQAAMRR